MDICWSCRISQARAYVRESWTTVSAARRHNGRLRKTKSKAYKSNAKPQGDGPEPREDETQRIVGAQRIILPGPTFTAPIVVSYPKITTAPSLVKRKFDSRHWDHIQDGIQGQKRDAAKCPASYDLCPADLNGGCCPSDRICGSDSCLANTSTVGYACGRANYIACGIAQGGGCCPSSYICATNGCTPSAGLAVTSTCSPGFFLCPAELNYGCCQNGLGCAINSCYNTDPVTFTLTQTSKSTDSNSIVHTVNTTIISKTIVGAPSTTVSAIRSIVAKESAIPAPIAKTSPTTSASPSSGLTKPELGGIIGVAGFLLLVIIIAALLILQRLNKAIRVSEASKSRTTSSQRHSRVPRHEDLRQREIDAMSIDPLIMSPSEASRSVRRPRRQQRRKVTLHETTHELASPLVVIVPNFHHPFRTESQSPFYDETAVESDSQSPSTTNKARNISADNTPPLPQGPNSSYFDYPLRSSRHYSQVPLRPSSHARNWSDTSGLSELSQDSAPSSDPAELDSDGRRNSYQWSLKQLRRSFSRKQSDAPMVVSGRPGRADWMGLGHIQEARESMVVVGEEGREGITNAGLRESSLMEREVRYDQTGDLGEGHEGRMRG